MESGTKQSRYAWLPQFMPAVAGLIRERRATHGDAWVNECWQRGVVQGEPGWFYAAEGSIAIGVPLSAQVVVQYHEVRAKLPDSVLLDMKVPE